jgi:hypothetical protein
LRPNCTEPKVYRIKIKAPFLSILKIKTQAKETCDANLHQFYESKMNQKSSYLKEKEYGILQTPTVAEPNEGQKQEL